LQDYVLSLSRILRRVSDDGMDQNCRCQQQGGFVREVVGGCGGKRQNARREENKPALSPLLVCLLNLKAKLKSGL
jgi:hypothetical protein